MKRFVPLAALACATTLSACSSMGGGIASDYYRLVRTKPMSVGDGSLIVTPTRYWNAERTRLFEDVRWVEDWTLNGPLLDDVTFVSGLPNDKYLVRTSSRESQQVPKFRSDMTAPEIQALLESAYRVRGGAIDFRTLSLTPRRFLGQPGFQLDYEHLDGDELWRKGRAVAAVIGGRLYLMMLDAARSHYFEDELDDFEALVASARLRSRR